MPSTPVVTLYRFVWEDKKIRCQVQGQHLWFLASDLYDAFEVDETHINNKRHIRPKYMRTCHFTQHIYVHEDGLAPLSLHSLREIQYTSDLMEHIDNAIIPLLIPSRWDERKPDYAW